MWEVTVNSHARHYHHTINIEAHIHTRCEGVSQYKGTDKAGRGGEGMSSGGSQDSHFHQIQNFEYIRRIPGRLISTGLM